MSSNSNVAAPAKTIVTVRAAEHHGEIGFHVFGSVTALNTPDYWPLDYFKDYEDGMDALGILAPSGYCRNQIWNQGSFDKALAVFIEQRGLEVDWSKTSHYKIVEIHQLGDEYHIVPDAEDYQKFFTETPAKEAAQAKQGAETRQGVSYQHVLVQPVKEQLF
jgi:hypothetical protein